MTSPFLLNPNSLGFNIRSPSLPGSRPSLTARSHDQRFFSTSSSSADATSPFVHTGVCDEAIYSSQPRIQADAPGIWGSFLPQATYSPSSLHLPESLGTLGSLTPARSPQMGQERSKLSFLSQATSPPSFLHLPGSLGPLFSIPPANTSQVAPEVSQLSEGDAFLKERLTDQVHVPFLVQGRGGPIMAPKGLSPMNEENEIGARLNITAGLTEELYMHRDPSKGKAPLILNDAVGTNQVHANEAKNTQYLSLINQVTLLSETQRIFNASISDMRSYNLELNRQVVEAQIMTTNKISAHDQEVEQKIDGLYAKLEEEEQKSDKMEVKEAQLEENLTSLQEKNVKTEDELEVKRENLKKMKKKAKKNDKILKCCCIGVVIGASFFVFRRFLR